MIVNYRSFLCPLYPNLDVEILEFHPLFVQLIVHLPLYGLLPVTCFLLYVKLLFVRYYPLFNQWSITSHLWCLLIIIMFHDSLCTGHLGLCYWLLIVPQFLLLIFHFLVHIFSFILLFFWLDSDFGWVSRGKSSHSSNMLQCMILSSSLLWFDFIHWEAFCNLMDNNMTILFPMIKKLPCSSSRGQISNEDQTRSIFHWGTTGTEPTEFVHRWQRKTIEDRFAV